MENESEVVRVPLFDGSNFASWKFRIQVVLEEHELLECIQNEMADVEELQVKQEDTDAVRQAKEKLAEKRRKKDRRCKSVLISRIHDSMLEYVQDKVTPRAIWLALEKVFERRSIASRLHLKKKLLMFRHEGGSLQDHFLAFDRIVREYRATGAVMEDIDVVCHLLLTLGPKFATVVTALETMPEDNLTLEFVKCRLLDEEIKCKGSSVGIAAKRESAAFSGKPKDNAKKMKCFICQKPGHKAVDCPEKKVKKEYKNKGSANVTEKSVCFVAGGSNDGRLQWYADSGATEHMANDRNLFEKLVPLKKPIEIAVALNGKSATAKFSGTIKVIAVNGNKRRECILEDVLYTPDLRCNLFSIRKVEMAGMRVVFENGGVKILRDSEVLACGKRRGFQYEMDFYPAEVDSSALYSCGKILKCHELWHRRYGHLSEKNLEKIMAKDMVKGLDKCASEDRVETICESCVDAKQTRKPFGERSEKRATRVLEVVHSDVCGPVTPVGHDGSRYYVSFIDDWSRFAMVFTMRSKDEVFGYFKQYEAMVTAKFGVGISRLVCDNGGEYRSAEFEEFCKKKGIQMQCTIPYTPEQNGVSERMNRTLEEKARSMLFSSGADKKFWCEAVETAAYLVNRSPASAINEGKTPFELWEGRKPDVSVMKVWGSPAYCHIPKERRKKLDKKAWKGVFLGYHCNGYRVWDPKREMVIAARDVIVDESESFQYKPDVQEKNPKRSKDAEIVRIRRLAESDSESDEGTSSAMDGVMDESVDHFEDCGGSISEGDDDSAGANQQVEVSSRKRAPPVWQKDYEMNYSAWALSAVSYVDNYPDSLAAMMKRDDWDQWEVAVQEEMKSHEQNNTWTLCELPEGRKPITCKWVFKVKKGEDGAPDRYKARLVARGFTQRYGYDYAETYAPVARMDTVRAVLSVANQERLQVHQLDVKTAFLNGTIQEEIYMVPPEGLVQGSKLVCRLNRALYGLKQASRAWNERFHQFVTRLGFKRSENDQCLYVRTTNGERLLLVLYVDDILIAGRDMKAISVIKSCFKKEFAMSDLGEVSCFLGMRIERDIEARFLRISQKAYLESLLRRFGMEDCKPAVTPVECHLKLKKGTEADRTDKPYRELVGCLAYVAHTSRPDLCAAVNVFSQLQSCPTDEHWRYLKRILRYVKGTLDVGLEFQGGDSEAALVVFSDADWGNDINDRRSMSGYILRVFGGTVAWLTRKQQTVALSSTEAEFVALCTATCEGIWMRRLLADLGVVIKESVVYYEDNQSCMRVAEEPRDSRRMKHVDIKFNFIRELVQRGDMVIKYIPSERQLADVMTKGLPAVAFKRLLEAIGIKGSRN